MYISDYFFPVLWVLLCWSILVHFLCQPGLCNAHSLQRLRVLCGQGIRQTGSDQRLDHCTSGTLLNTGANQVHFKKKSQLLPNGKSVTPALLSSESVGCWLSTEFFFFFRKWSHWKLQKYLCIKKVRVYCNFKTTEFELAQVTSQIWTNGFKLLGD